MSATATREPALDGELEEVPNRCLRRCFEKLERRGVSAGDVAVWAGFANKHRADGTRVRRLLGIIENNPERALGEQPTYRSSLPYQDAVTLALAMGLDPVDLDL